MLYGAFLVTVGVVVFIVLTMIKDMWTYTIIRETIELMERQEPKSLPTGDTRTIILENQLYKMRKH